MRAWHFCKERDGKPILRDGRPALLGEWLIHDEKTEGTVLICHNGLHASLNALDALTYAPGSWCCLVDVEDIVTQQEDKLVCRRRKVVAMADVSTTLKDFARWTALQVVDLWDCQAIVKTFLETGDESLRTPARDAANAANATAAAASAYYATTAYAAATAASYAAAAYYAATAASYAAAASANDSKRHEFNLELEARLLKALSM